jgi:hypothetical protein
MNKSFEVVRDESFVSIFAPQSVISDMRVRFLDWAKFLGLEIGIEKSYMITVVK